MGGDGKQRLNKVAQPATPASKSAGRIVGEQRRPTGAIPPGTFIKPVPLKQAGRQATSPHLGNKGAPAAPSRKPSAPVTQAAGNARKPSAATKPRPPGDHSKKPHPPNTFSPDTLRKGADNLRKGVDQESRPKVSPSTIRKASEQQAVSKASPSGARKPSAPQQAFGKGSPGTLRKPSGQQAAGKVSPNPLRKPSGQQVPTGARKPSAGGANKPATGPASKWR